MIGRDQFTMDPLTAPTFPSPTPWVQAHLLNDFDLLDFTPGSRVLDIGCGRGRNLVPLLAAGVKAEGVDSDPSCVAECERFALPARLARAEALPFDDASFDGCLLDQVLPYTDPVAALREVARVLKPGGHALLTAQGPGYAAHVFASRRGRGRLFGLRMMLSAMTFRLAGRPAGDTLIVTIPQVAQLVAGAGLQPEIIAEGPRFYGLSVFLYARLHKPKIAVATSA